MNLLTDLCVDDAALNAPATYIIACGALAREIIAIVEVNQLPNLKVLYLPAKLHNRPEKIPDAVRGKLVEAKAAGAQNLFVAYADCGTGGLLDAVCVEFGAERIAGPHCYAFFSGTDAFVTASETEIDTFYLTDFLARQFDTLIWRGFGLENPIVREMMFTHYRKLVYLAQTDNPALDAAAEQAAARLGLAYERRSTGYGDLPEFLSAAAGRGDVSSPHL